MAYLFLLALIGLAIYTLTVRDKLSSSEKEFHDLKKRFDSYKRSTDKQIQSHKSRIAQLSKYQKIVDVETEAERIRNEALELRSTIQHDYDIEIAKATELGNQELLRAQAEAERIQNEALELRSAIQHDYDTEIAKATELGKEELRKTREKARTIQEKADALLAEAHDIASEIEKSARRRAEEIAGSALKAKEDAERYESAEKAMRNLIKGYGDEYLSPNRPVINDLVEQYDFKDAGQKLKQTKALIQSLLRNDKAADCAYVEDYRKRTAIEFVLDAFNGKVDSIMSKVKSNNYDTLEEQILDAYSIVNHNGKAFRSAHITKAYLDATIEQLKWATIVQKIRQDDREEQRRIKEQIREEERARREYEKAKKQAEKEERMLQKAMKEVEQKLALAAQEEKTKYENEISKLRASLEDAMERGERAISMAQQTKQGHVYVISNIGSFGEEVIKVGLTRRLEPMDRVKELGDASVPFAFDVHAMIFASDAPALEKKLHEILEDNRVNKVNPRKEFFRVPVAEIKKLVEESGYSVHWTMKAEAAEYRESLKQEKTSKSTTSA